MPPLPTPRPSIPLSRLRVGLGTFIAIDARGTSRTLSEAGIAAAYAAVARVENLLHPTRTGSDVAALSAGALGTARRVHPWTWQVLDLCQRLNQQSQGIFDPCLPEWSSTPSPGRWADLEMLRQPCTRGSTVILHAHLRLDLGGIAKGFAVDRAIDALRAAGCHAGLVNAGGDLAVFGDCDHQVFCRHGRGTSMVTLRNSALATSTVENVSQPAQHRGYYNAADRGAIITGSAAVTAPSAAIADGLTKCLLAGDVALNAALLDSFAARQIAH